MFTTVANNNQKLQLMRNRPNVNTKKNRKFQHIDGKKIKIK
jgi:hypothetical protein